MELPKSIKILSSIYSVEEMSLMDTIRDDKFGFCDSNEKLIRVGQCWGNRERALTLLHEILHGIYREMGMEQAEDLKEEYIVTTLTNGLCAVIADNPGLMASIEGGLKNEKID